MDESSGQAGSIPPDPRALSVHFGGRDKPPLRLSGRGETCPDRGGCCWVAGGGQSLLLPRTRRGHDWTVRAGDSILTRGRGRAPGGGNGRTEGRRKFKGEWKFKKKKKKQQQHTRGKSEGLLIPRLVRAGSSAGAASNSVRLAVQQQRHGAGRADAAGECVCVCDGRVERVQSAKRRYCRRPSPPLSLLAKRSGDMRGGRGGAANPCKLAARVFPHFSPCRRCSCVACV